VIVGLAGLVRASSAGELGIQSISSSGLERRFSMDEATARAMIQANFVASNVGAAGG
jgi:hypothetical protein